MKFAGYDVIIIEGKAKSPVWLKIKDDKVSPEKADFLWRKGTRERRNKFVISPVRKPVWWLLVRLAKPCSSGMLNSRNHSGGAGTGAIMGSKNLKAIAVEGTKGVNIADCQEMKRLNDYMMTELIGANNNRCRAKYAAIVGRAFIFRSHVGQHVKGCFGARLRWSD
ncbi:aldehyde ferredoxin oxidoreductase N-terminal domain-containing protein [Escherichia coli]